MNVKTATPVYPCRAGGGAGARRGGSQSADDLLGLVVVRSAGHGASWELLAERQPDIEKSVGQELTLVKVGELLERSGTVVPPRGHRLVVEAPGGGHMRRPHCPQSRLTITVTSSFSVWL